MRGFFGALKFFMLGLMEKIGWPMMWNEDTHHTRQGARSFATVEEVKSSAAEVQRRVRLGCEVGAVWKIRLREDVFSSW